MSNTSELRTPGAAPPVWLAAVAAQDDRMETARARHARELAEVADDRARAIAHAVAKHGRGGREHVAAALGISVGQVDKAIARARHKDVPTHLPDDAETLRRLYAAEVPDLPPLTEAQWRTVAALVRSLIIDASWIESGPGKLLAEEYAEAAEDGDANPDAVLVEVMSGWTRTQALAVIDALQRGALAALPGWATA